MIVSNINSPELEKYLLTNERFAVAFDFVKKIFADGVEDGRHVIDGDALYVNVMTYESKEAERSCFEAHKNYIDIQVIIEGEEIIGFESNDKLTVTKGYDAEGDYMLYSLNDKYDSIRVGSGEFAIIFPEEPHAPGIAADGKPARVRKAVVKVRV
jgi:YhcH/YjgK/YiaL family protein